MKINKTSWHYKFNKSFHSGNVPDNLCNYFWTIPLGALIFALLVLCSLMILLITTLPIWAPIVNHYNPEHGTPNGVILMVVIGDIIIGTLLFGAYFKKNSFVRLVIEYITAVKNKHCPMIEFTDKE